MDPLPRRHWIPALLLATAFLIRALLFAQSFGSVEGDSGWDLGVAKNFAKRGLYATYTNFSIDSNPITLYIHGKPSLQDNEGYTFAPEISVGPGYIFPEAAILKIFGEGPWTYRAWALTTYFGLFLVIFYIAGLWGGGLAQGLLGLWFWSVPALHLIYSYESLAEHTALFYGVAGLLVLSSSVPAVPPPKTKLYFAGLLIGAAVMTKLILALLASAVAIYGVYQCIRNRRQGVFYLKFWSLVAVGILTPILGFHAFRGFHWISRFGVEGWLFAHKGMIDFFMEAGSGLGKSSEEIASLLPLKLTLWEDAAIAHPGVGWSLLVLSLAYSLSKLRHSSSLYPITFIYLTLSYGWFFLINSSAWTRHAWAFVILGILLIGSTLSIWLQSILRNQQFGRLAGALLASMALVYLLSSIDPRKTLFFLRADEEIVDHLNDLRMSRGTSGVPPPILPLEEQKQVVAYFHEHVRPEDYVYNTRFLTTEIPALVDKVFFHLIRYKEFKHTSKIGRHLLFMGSFQRGGWNWQVPFAENSDELNQRLCDRTLFASRTYLLCELKSNLTEDISRY